MPLPGEGSSSLSNRPYSTHWFWSICFEDPASLQALLTSFAPNPGHKPTKGTEMQQAASASITLEIKALGSAKQEPYCCLHINQSHAADSS